MRGLGGEEEAQPGEGERGGKGRRGGEKAPRYSIELH